MATRKDLLKAHNFTTQRMVSALVDRDPDAPVSPLRRITTATFVSILIGVVALAGSFLIGKLRPGMATDWKQEGTVVIDTDSTTIYVYNGAALVPMTDMTSARMYALGRAGADSATVPPIRQVRASVLVGTPVSQRFGIPNAPYALPPSSRVNAFPLRTCAAAPIGDKRPITIDFGGNFTASNQDVSIIAQSATGELFLIFRGIAHRLYTENGTSSLQEQIPSVRLPDAWIAALPLGNPIDKLVLVNNGGQPERTPSTPRLVGTVISNDPDPKVQGDERFYVQTNQGLQRLSWVDKMLFQPDAVVSESSDRIAQDLADPAQVPAAERVGTVGLPLDMPVTPSQELSTLSVCLTYSGPVNYSGADGSAAPRLSVGATVTVPRGTQINGVKADVVTAPSAGGALLQKDSLTGVDQPSTLVQNGKRYDIPTRSARIALGYPDDSPPSLVPAGLINLIPDGLAAGITLTPTAVRPMP